MGIYKIVTAISGVISLLLVFTSVLENWKECPCVTKSTKSEAEALPEMPTDVKDSTTCLNGKRYAYVDGELNNKIAYKCLGSDKYNRPIGLAQNQDCLAHGNCRGLITDFVRLAFIVFLGLSPIHFKIKMAVFSVCYGIYWDTKNNVFAISPFPIFCGLCLAAYHYIDKHGFEDFDDTDSLFTFIFNTPRAGPQPNLAPRQLANLQRVRDGNGRYIRKTGYK